MKLISSICQFSVWACARMHYDAISSRARRVTFFFAGARECLFVHANALSDERNKWAEGGLKGCSNGSETHVNVGTSLGVLKTLERTRTAVASIILIFNGTVMRQRKILSYRTKVLWNYMRITFGVSLKRIIWSVSQLLLPENLMEIRKFYYCDFIMDV